MLNVKRRQQSIRARACDAYELVDLARRPDIEQWELEARLENVLASALFAFRCHEQPLFGNSMGLTLHPAGDEHRLDESLDRAKGVIEFEVPFLLLLTGQTHAECRQRVETIIERLIQGDVLCQRFVGEPVVDAEAARRFTGWAFEAVDAVFQAHEWVTRAKRN